MKSYDELKAIQQQMIEAKKNERANALKEAKSLDLWLECRRVHWLKVGRNYEKACWYYS